MGLGAALNSLSDAVRGWLGLGSLQVAMPAGCRLEDFLATGVCKLQFSGLQTLFPGKDITLRVVMRRCATATAEGLPEVYVDCMGNDCSSIIQAYNYQFCLQDADCGATSVCKLFSDYSVSGGADPIAQLLWGGGASDTCATSDTFAFNITQLLARLGGTGAVPAQPSRFNGLCQPQLENLRNFKSWVAGLRTVTNGLTYIAGLDTYRFLPGEVSVTNSSALPCALNPAAAPAVFTTLNATSSTPPNTNTSNTSTPSPFADLVVLDCQGNVHGLSSHPALAFDVGLATGAASKIYGFLRDAVLGRMACHCPALTRTPGLLEHYYKMDVATLLATLREWYVDADRSRLHAMCGDAALAMQSIASVFGIPGSLPGAFVQQCGCDRDEVTCFFEVTKF